MRVRCVTDHRFSPLTLWPKVTDMISDRIDRRTSRNRSACGTDNRRPLIKVDRDQQILVVEDDIGARGAMTDMLEDHGYTVDAVGTSSDALDPFAAGA